ncbi:extracellular solute-binding protein [Pseudomonas sp. WS 5013]|uniref:ABC transporter substrate-binding protein n=1 Tax=Pseudomonas sp. WS 5013 TaxID=2717475 RepID=UPI00147422BD|nr:extracellular solute-binding protein [Pseudomonas sp. WS 5013]NMY42127.1 extracellular solute-binding protein [Pseudomonas sp. WS 5013]
MTRRTPLALSVVLALGLSGAAQAAGTLNFANWSDYYPPELLQKFEKDTGIKATLDAYDSNETLLAKLKAGGGNYDVVVPSDSFIQIMVQEDLLQKFDKSKLPNLKNLAPTFQKLDFDPAHDYSVPYLWGTTGYSYDSTQVPGGKLDESWGPFFAPPAELKGKVVALNSMDDLFPPAAFYLGIDRCTEDPQDVKKIMDLLSQQKDMLAMYNSDGTIERMAAGEVAMHQQWNGAFHRAKEQRASLVYVYPKEGVSTFIDNFVIPKGASNVEEAHVFINWMMQPENIAAASNFAKYNNAIAGAEQFMDKALFEDPAINTPQDKLERLRSFKLCSPKALALRTKVWTKLKK